MHPPTARFQHSLPFAIQQVSPSTAALHAARVRRAYPDDTTLTSSHCAKCGLYLLDGAGSSRVTRSHRTKRRRSNAYTHQSCASCGHSEYIPRDRGNASLFKKVMPSKPASDVTPADGDAPRVKPNHTIAPSPSASSSIVPSPSNVPSPSQTEAQAKNARTKKKRSGLQEMLARNKQKQEVGRPGKGTAEGAGLADFLSGLQ